MKNELTVGEELSSRKKLILRSVIEAHIATGEPIGSKSLMTRSEIPYSSATIRNEMAELENLGYLEQPHTSAGRVPTGRGYRFYVDALMESYKLTATELVSLNAIIRDKMGELNSILRSASKLIASMTNYTSIAVRAKNANVKRVEQFSYMLIDAGSFLLVMRMSDGTVATKHLHTELPLDDELLTRLIHVLNTYIATLGSEDITLPTLMQAEAQMRGAESLINLSIKAVYETIGKSEEAVVSVEGINKLLEYPEFADVEQMRQIISILENKSDLSRIVESADSDKVNILIGRDSALVERSAFVFKTIKVGGKAVGAIGVFGPSRMDYSKVISTVEYLSRQLSDADEDPVGLLGDGHKY
ncbi:MAG: heat-inducible transcription repressor HrcA [Clostridia bacterium]|nr:heat-inducible transcription repressor HrcA [Clostridia bacterium]